MYERTYGHLYDSLGDHPSAAEIAKAMRQTIKQETAEGFLPSKWKYSVTSDTFTGGQSVDIVVQDCPDAWEVCDGIDCQNVWCAAKNDPIYAHAATEHLRLTEEAKVTKMTLDRIHGAYNHDGSELMVDYFDVRYYGHVEFDTPDATAFRQREKERLAAKKAETEAGTPVGLAVNYKRSGGRTVHLLIEKPEGGQVYACGAPRRRSSLISKAALGTLGIDCSRCAKAAKERGVIGD